MYRNQQSAILLGMFLIMWGCGRGSRLPGETGRVHGTAIYQSKAIPTGSVVVMVHDQTGIVATGVTDSAGNFTMNMRGKPEVLVGEYHVNIRPVGDVDENVSVLTPETVPKTWKEVPQKYWSGTDSPERFVVKPGKNEYQLTLRD